MMHEESHLILLKYVEVSGQVVGHSQEVLDFRNVQMKCDIWSDGKMAEEVQVFKGWWGLPQNWPTFFCSFLLLPYNISSSYCCVTSVCLQMMALAIWLTIIPKYAGS